MKRHAIGAWVLIGLAAMRFAAAPAAAVAPPPPLKIDLDAFDARKKIMALPDGVSLAYIDMGDPAARTFEQTGVLLQPPRFCV